MRSREGISSTTVSGLQPRGYQPEEHELALSRGTLLELQEALLEMQSKPVRLALRDITIWPR